MHSTTRRGWGGFRPPPDGEEFELVLETSPDALEMLKGNGYGCDPAGWKYIRKDFTPGTRRFKLVRTTSHCRNLDEVLAQLGKENMPEGVWREAFVQRSPLCDGKGSIGFADPSWISPDGHPLFPVLHASDEGWIHYFDHHCENPSGGHDTNWRWLVEVK